MADISQSGSTTSDIQLSGDLTPTGVEKNGNKTSGLEGEIDNALRAEREEHSVLGRAVAVARDLLQGQVHNIREKKERAESNDEIAKIAVDTLASIPKINILGAGAIRAIALADTTESLHNNLVSGLTNFAEGAALNRVSHFKAQGVHGLFASGAAIGAIRTGFDNKSWHDKDGRFDPLAASQRIAKGSLAGAFLTVPAGLAGSRVALHFGAENAASTVASRFFASTTSGYVAGSVYGGLDAIVSGGSAKDVLSAIGTGGVTGALTGGLVHSFTGSSGRNSESNAARFEFKPQQEIHANLRQGEPVRELENPPLTAYSHKDEMENVYKELAYTPITRPKFGELNSRITPIIRFEAANEVRVRGGDQNKTWEDQASFSRSLVYDRVDMAVYGARGADFQRLPVEIHVPVKYDNTVIKPLRALRAVASTDLPIDKQDAVMRYFVHKKLNDENVTQFLDSRSPEARQKLLDDFAKMTPEERTLTATVFNARQLLDTHPHRLTLLPEDVLPYLEQSKNVRKIVLTDKNWAYDTWMRQDRNAAYFNPSFTAAATAEHATGTMTFYKGTLRPDPEAPQTANTFSDLFNHEDTHLMRGFKPVYDAAHALDSKHYDEPAFAVSEYARLNEEEDRAESRTAFLQADPTGFWLLTKEAQLRAAVLAKAESQYLEQFKVGEHPYEQTIRNRISNVEQFVTPVARAMAVGHLISGDIEQATLAAKVLGTIGTKEDIPELEKIARLDGRAQIYLNRRSEIEKGLPPKSPQAQSDELMRAKDPMNPYNRAAKEAFDSIVKLSADNDSGRVKALVKLATSDPQLRHLALETIQDGSLGTKGTEYTEMLRHFGNPNNLPAIVREIERTNDAEIKSLGFAELMRLSQNQPAIQRDIAYKMFHEQPALADEAMDALMKQLSETRSPK